MAACATDREAHQSATNDVDGVVERVVVEFAILAAAEAEEAHACECARVLGGFELVGGDLFEQEAVVGLVRVEGVDDVVAVSEGVWVGVIAVVDAAHVVSVAHDIEPVAAPALAVAFVGEEFVDELLEGLRVVVSGESVHFRVRRWHADQIEISAADEGAFVGRFFVSGADEGV